MTAKEQVKLELLMKKIVSIKADISDLKNDILNPNDGLIVNNNQNTWFRKENEGLIKEIPTLIQFKKTTYRILWIIITALVAIGVRIISIH